MTHSLLNNLLENNKLLNKTLKPIDSTINLNKPIASNFLTKIASIISEIKESGSLSLFKIS